MDSSVSLLRIGAFALGFLPILGTLLLMVFKKFRSNPQNKIMASSSSSPSWTHDVYPSYCGEDISKVFLSHILREFMSNGFVTFNDSGLELSKFTKAIRGSRIALVVLSREYTSSLFCLDELVEIIKCRDELGQTVVPVFYGLDQIDVMKLTGDLGERFRTTCVGRTKEETDRWRRALETVAAIPGYHSRSWDFEGEIIEQIATDIANSDGHLRVLRKSKKEWEIELPRLKTRVDGKLGSIRDSTYDSLCGEDKEIADCELNAKGGFLARFHSEHSKQMLEPIITNQDVQEDSITSEIAFKGIPNGLLHTVYIYCADTLQYSFASHLSMDFRRKGIAAFVNCNRSLDVIQGASASVVVFSKNYVSPTSYLDKLVTVLQRRSKSGQLVVPVFYGISPSDVAVPENALANRIRGWSSALKELTELPSHRFREECSECELVEEIVKNVYEKLFPTEQIGVNLRLLEIEQLLCKQPWDIRRIGIWGMPGIGKTTLAKAFFDQISGGYEASCFIEHFEKAFHEKGFHRLLEKHFGRTLKELPRVCSSITRPSLPGDKLTKKRTLIVLDEVENASTAESFLGKIHWFGPGSLIIITSRDKQVFRLCQINHVYQVQSLNENEALQLFSQCAFGEDIREENLLGLSMEVIDYANGNPLALSFYGRELKGKKLSEMETTFLKHKLRTPYKIYDLFYSSYKTLNDNQKNIFLDIACFFKGENVDYVMQLLEGCVFFPHIGIDVLVEKCLVIISENRLKMDRIIEDFGKEIINRETVQIERRRRLWEPWTIKFLLEDNKLEAHGYPKETCKRALGTEDIEGIFLDTSNFHFDVKPTAFENMLNLRFLKIYCSIHENQYELGLPRGLESLPHELRLLHWENYPLQSLPQDFDPGLLVELNMSYSQLQKLWGGTKNLEMLKLFKLCHSQQLTEIEDLCKATNIELIDVQGCTKLQRFPATGKLQHLRVVNLSGCTEIRSFPEVSPKIEELHLQGTGIREFPISLVAQVVSSNQHLDKLVLLNMKDCYHLQSLPQMVDLESLEVLDLSGCSELKSIQRFPRNLKELYLVGTAVRELPPLPWSLELLNAHGCVSLISIPFGFDRLPRYYTFSNCFALSAQVVSEFIVNALTNVERIAREYQPEVNKSLAFSFTVPSSSSKQLICDLQPGSSVMIQLGSWRATLGFAIFVELSFLEDYHKASGFGISCVCRWKDKGFISHRLEKSFHCWTPGEGVQRDHMFVFCDLSMHPSTCEGNDPSILADCVVFEFFAVNKQKKPCCIVKKCGVRVITAANGDASSNMAQPSKKVRSGSLGGGGNYTLCPVDDCTQDLSHAKDYHSDSSAISTAKLSRKLQLSRIRGNCNYQSLYKCVAYIRMTDSVDLGVGSAGGAVVSGALKAVITEAKKDKSFKPLSNDLVSTVQIDHGEELIDTMKRARLLGDKFPAVGSYNKLKYVRKIEGINKATFLGLEGNLVDKVDGLSKGINKATFLGLEGNLVIKVDGLSKRMDGLSVHVPVFTDLCSVPKLDKVLVGLDWPLVEVKKKLLDNAVVNLVVSAPPGCGKTTLVTQLCHEAEIKGKFKHIFFCVVSSTPNFRVIVQNLLQHNGYAPQIFENDSQATVALRKLLEQLIEDGPILLVLDNVWPGAESWLHKFRSTLPDYKILVTSRSDFPSFGSSYRLKPLEDEDARALLIQWASRPDNASPAFYKDLLQKILKRCNGLPIVIEVVGVSLKGKTLTYWQGQVLSWSQGEPILDSPPRTVLGCLQPSFSALEPNLKECFLDMGSFLEDQKIRASVIIDIWVEIYGKSDIVCMKYLEDLASQNLLKLVPLGNEHEDGFYNEFLVTQHDILRELAIHQSELKENLKRKRRNLEIREDKFPDWCVNPRLPIINASLLSISTDDLFSSNWVEMDCPNVEALVLNISSAEYALPSFIDGMKKLKVLIITNHGSCPARLRNFLCLSLLPNLKRIRLERVSVTSLDIFQLQLVSLKKLSFVMCSFSEVFYDIEEIDVSKALPSLQEIDIDYCYDLDELPYWVTEVVSLKTLSITNCNKLTILPEAMGNLCKLEMLRLSSCINLSELPETIERLSHLRFLDISHCLGLRKLPLEIGKLQKLKKISMRKCWRCELPDSVMNLENLEVKCDEETGMILWERLKPKMINLRVQEEEPEHNLNLLQMF